MFSPKLINYLKSNKCPDCESSLEFDEGHLHCPKCKIGYNYRNFKDCERAYDFDSAAYIKNYALADESK